MQHMDSFVRMVVAAHKQGVSLITLKLLLTREGVSDEEVSDLLDLVVIEARSKTNYGVASCILK